MNTSARNKQFFTSTAEFRQKIDDFFKLTLSEISTALGSIINEIFQQPTPAS